MARTNKSEATIDVARERLFAYLADFARHPEWAEPKDQLRIEPPTAVRVGATFVSVGKDMGRDSRNEVTITEIVPGERLVYEARMDNGTRWRNSLVLSDDGGKTRVVKTETFLGAKFPMSVIVPIVLALSGGEVRNILARDLTRIAARVAASARSEEA